MTRLMKRMGDPTTTALTFYQQGIYFISLVTLQERDLNSTDFISTEGEIKHTDITGQRLFCRSGWG